MNTKRRLITSIGVLWYSIFVVAGSSNGRIHDSESCHLGSNPSPAVLSAAENCGKKAELFV